MSLKTEKWFRNFKGILGLNFLRDLYEDLLNIQSSSGDSTLAEVLANGNTTGANAILVDGGNGVLDSSSENSGMTFYADNSGFYLEGTDGADGGLIEFLTDGNINIRGTAGFKGAKYSADYSAAYTSRSLVDKSYVDTAIPTFTWTDYSATSTITGWSAPTKTIKYTKAGKVLIVRYNIDSFSNSINASFTIPYTANGDQYFLISFVENNSGTQATPGFASIQNGSSTVQLYPDANMGNWAAANVKKTVGDAIIEIN